MGLSGSKQSEYARKLEDIAYLEDKINRMTSTHSAITREQADDCDHKIDDASNRCNKQLIAKEKQCESVISKKINSIQKRSEVQIQAYSETSEKNRAHIKMLEEELTKLEYRLEMQESNVNINHRLAVDSARVNVIDREISKMENKNDN
jgi:SMC interacting uncharacterized protein involved in chromosome segregation